MKEWKRMRVMDVFSLPSSCVYALVCEESKCFTIGHTKYLYTALARIFNNLETPKYWKIKRDMEKLDLIVLNSEVQDNLTRRIKVNEYTEEYLKNGYEQYLPSNLVKYTLYSELHNIYNHIYFVVYLKDRRSNKIAVGYFTKETEMNAFIDKYYPNRKVNGIYYSDNKYTVNFRKNMI